jgi:hypothetical protein
MSTIQAKIILDSISPGGVRLTTFELEYPRFILAEFNTHRMISKNTASSRAIPVAKMLEYVSNQPAVPVEWGKNQPGMRADEQVNTETAKNAEFTWLQARDHAVKFSSVLHELGIHKQVANRLVEPFQTVKTVATATEWANLWWLRDHPDAQPEFRELAHKMHRLYKQSQPVPVQAGEWHLPYVPTKRAFNHSIMYIDETTGQEMSVELAIQVSASCCAQVSYRKTDMTVSKAKRIYHQLIDSKPAHASPVEHQATPIQQGNEPGVSHLDKHGNLWSGNFRGWIQHRKTIPEEAKW